MPESTRNLWAPWRMEYIDGLEDGQSEACFLCDAIARPTADDAETLIVRRGEQAMTILNRFPYSSGHVLVAPNHHVSAIEDLSDGCLLEIMHQTRDAKRILQNAINAQGFNVGMNLGHCAGAGLPGHLHLHVVPRWSGDTNFMAVIGDAKVIPQSLEKVRQLFLQEGARLDILPHDAASE